MIVAPNKQKQMEKDIEQIFSNFSMPGLSLDKNQSLLLSSLHFSWHMKDPVIPKCIFTTIPQLLA